MEYVSTEKTGKSVNKRMTSVGQCTLSCVHLLMNSFVFSGSDLWQSDAMRTFFGGQTVEVDGQVEFSSQPKAEFFGALDTVLDVDAL